MDVIVLVGGRGTRLRAIISDRPKAMAEVGGRPLLEWLLLQLHAKGLRRLIFASGYRAQMIETYFGDGRRFGMELIHSPESHPLGTGGAIRHSLEKVRTNPVLVVNGDTLCPFDVRQMTEEHSKNEAAVTLWLVHAEDSGRYGSVEIDPRGRVVRFMEKSSNGNPGLVSAGLYLCATDRLAAIPTDRAVSLEREVLPALIGRGLYGTVGMVPFVDIGTPESHEIADRVFLQSAAWRAQLKTNPARVARPAAREL